VRPRALFSILAVAFALARPAAAQDRPDDPTESLPRKQSRAMFRRGVAAAEAQRWSEARDDFQKAFQLFPHPSILLDLGVSRSHVGEYEQAEQDLTRFMAEDTGATADELQAARLALVDVRKHLGTIRVRVSPAGAIATVDQRPVALVEGQLADVRVALGPHELEAHAPGHEEWKGRVIVDGPEAKVVDLTLAALAKPKPHAGVPAQRIVSFVLFGTGVALAGFGIFAGVHSIDLANQYNTPTEPNYQNPATKSEGIAFRTAADVTLVLAAACVAAGLVLYFTTPKHTTHVALAPTGLTVRF
jgi:hypothetical protein